MAEPDPFLITMSKKFPEFQGTRPPGFFLRFAAFSLDVSICSWIISQLLLPVARRYRERFMEILGIRSFGLAIDAGTSDIRELSARIEETLRETTIDLTEMNLAFGIAVLIISCFVFVVYYYLFEASFLSATPGKAAFGIRVVRENLERLGIFRALLRQGARLVTLSSLGLGYFLLFFTTKRETLHDWLSGTRLLRVQSKIARTYRLLSLILFLGSAALAAYSVYQRVLVASRWFQLARMVMPQFFRGMDIPDLTDIL